MMDENEDNEVTGDFEDQSDNPLDDDLLKELGLEPRAKTEPKKAPAPKPAPPAEDPFDDLMPSQPKAKPPEPRAQTQGPPAAAPKKSAPAPAPASSASNPAKNFDDDISNLAKDMPVQLVAVLGKKTMTLREILQMKKGEIVELKRLPQEGIDLVANGKLVARGELVLVDGQLGIQIKQMT